MAVRICGVEKGSPSERAGIAAGDELIAINGHDIADVLDYRFYMCEKNLTVTLGRGNVNVTKGEYEDLGLEFESYLMDNKRSCQNRCIFCFIDQLPPGLRESLYFKDDDARLSFLFGNYITLTNLTSREIERIIEMHISPVNVSVHCTDDELRVKLMGNKNAAGVKDTLRRFADAGISLNIQLVLCPGINDEEALLESLADLSLLRPALQSVAVIPVGITSHREGLYPLVPYTKEGARAVIAAVDAFVQENGERYVYPADEFFLKAGMPVPGYEYYGDFHQLENGVGLIADMRESFFYALSELPLTTITRTVTVVTGTAAYDFICTLADRLMERISGLSIHVVRVHNTLFGEHVTVAGLLSGADVAEQLLHEDIGHHMVLPAVMFNRDGLTLDGLTKKDMEKRLNTRIELSPNDGDGFISALIGNE